MYINVMRTCQMLCFNSRTGRWLLAGPLQPQDGPRMTQDHQRSILLLPCLPREVQLQRQRRMCRHKLFRKWNRSKWWKSGIVWLCWFLWLSGRNHQKPPESLTSGRPWRTFKRIRTAKGMALTIYQIILDHISISDLWASLAYYQNKWNGSKESKGSKGTILTGSK
jgi:hypothetical protein